MFRIALYAAAMLACLVSQPTSAAYFHLSQPGLCNHTSKAIENSGILIGCSDGCDTCKATDSHAIGGFGPEREGWTLHAGVCATMSFEIGGEATSSCTADIDVVLDAVSCSFLLTVSATGSKSIHMNGCDQGGGFKMVPDHGSEHFQVEIKPSE